MTQTAMGPAGVIIIQLRILIKNSPPPSLKKKKKSQTNQFHLKEYMGIRSKSWEGDGERDGMRREC